MSNKSLWIEHWSTVKMVSEKVKTKVFFVIISHCPSQIFNVKPHVAYESSFFFFNVHATNKMLGTKFNLCSKYSLTLFQFHFEKQTTIAHKFTGLKQGVMNAHGCYFITNWCLINKHPNDEKIFLFSWVEFCVCCEYFVENGIIIFHALHFVYFDRNSSRKTIVVMHNLKTRISQSAWCSVIEK